MKYTIEIEETLSRVVEIEADSLVEAIDSIKHRYKNEEIVLSEGDYLKTDFIPKMD